LWVASGRASNAAAPNRPGRSPARGSHEHDTAFSCGDLTDATNLIRLVQETQPDEIYNLAA
jgi:GDP-D-mannose dehydratase